MNLKKSIQDMILWRGLNFLSIFVLNVLIARLLEASGAGILFFFINNMSLLILILSFSLEAGLGYYGAGHKIEGNKLGAWALLWSLLATVIGTFLIYGLTTWTTGINGIDTHIAAVLFMAGTLLTSFFSALYFAREEFVLPNVLLFVVNMLLIGVFIAASKGLIHSTALLYCYFIGFLIQGLLLAGFYFPKAKPISPGNSQSYGIRDVLKYSSAVFFGNLIFFLVYRVDYWFVEIWSSTEELGNYIQVSKIVQWLLLLPMLIGGVVFPMTASGKDEAISQKVILLSRILLWVYIFGCLLGAITGFWVFTWLFGGTYDKMYPVFLLHIPGIVALASLYPLSSYNAGVRRVDINVKGSLYALLVIVVVNVLFTPAYGIYAASVASSVGYITYFLFSFYQFNKENKVSLYQVFRPEANDYRLLKSVLYRRK